MVASEVLSDNMTAMGIVFTEDEVIAVAGVRGTAWPTPFRLLDNADPDVDDARASYVRGIRSLRARGLLTVEDHVFVLDAALHRLLGLMSPQSWVAVYPARSAERPLESAYPIVYFHLDGASPSVVVEYESGTGLRTLAVAERDRCSQQIVASARRAFRSEPPTAGVHVAAETDGGSTVLAAHPGLVTTATLDTTGATTSVSRSPFFESDGFDTVLSPDPRPSRHA